MSNQLPKMPSLPKVKKLVRCACGCTGTTQSRFCPGHDAIHYGMIRRVKNGWWDADNPTDVTAQLDKAAEQMSIGQARATAQAMGVEWKPKSERKAPTKTA